MLLSLLFGVLFPSRLNIKCCLQEGLRGWSSAPLPCLSTEALFTARTTAPDTSSQEPALLEQARNSNTTFAGQHPLLLTTLGPEKGARRILHSCRHPPSTRGLVLNTDKYQLSAPGPASSHTIQQTAQMSELPAQTGYTGMNEKRAGCPPRCSGFHNLQAANRSHKFWELFLARSPTWNCSNAFTASSSEMPSLLPRATLHTGG